MINPSNSYYKGIKDKLFKVLCLFEEKNETVFININSLIFELNGMTYVVGSDKENYIIDIIVNLESLLDESICAEFDHETIRREIFKSMSIIDKLIQENGG